MKDGATTVLRLYGTNCENEYKKYSLLFITPTNPEARFQSRALVILHLFATISRSHKKGQ
jgi:hypothetical protein